MSDMSDLAFLDATAQAELVQNNEVKPLELVDAAIERIERLNPQLDATCGPDLGDPYWAPPRIRPFIEEVGAAVLE